MSEKTTNSERSGLKLKSALKAGRIAVNHNSRPRSAAPASGAAEPSLDASGGLCVQTGLRSGFGLGRGPGPAPGG